MNGKYEEGRRTAAVSDTPLVGEGSPITSVINAGRASLR